MANQFLYLWGFQFILRTPRVSGGSATEGKAAGMIPVAFVLLGHFNEPEKAKWAMAG